MDRLARPHHCVCEESGKNRGMVVGGVMKIPKAAKKTPRCPLCHAMFAEQVIKSRVAEFSVCDCGATPLKPDALAVCETCKKTRTRHKTDGRAFFCHFCRITVMANDPFVGRWEEAYAMGEQVFCPSGKHPDQVMRFFATATGYVQFKCPRKDCQAKMETKQPDRREGEEALYDAKGERIALPGVNGAVATPENPSIAQVAGSGGEKAAGLPDVTDITVPLPPLRQ